MRTGSFYQDDQAVLDADISAYEQQLSDDIKAQKVIDEGEDMRNRVEASKYSMTDLFAAGFERENEITSAIRYNQDMAGTTNEPEENYDVFSDIAGYEPFAQRFVNVRNKRRATAIKGVIDREGRNNKLLELHGAGGTIAMMTAGMLSPSAVASMAAPAGVALKATKAGMRIGAARTAVKAGAVGAPFNALGEAALHTTQETRTPEETKMNLAAGLIIDSTMAGVIVKGSPHYKALKSKVEADLSTEAVQRNSVIDEILAEGEDSAGARATSVAVEGGDAPASGAPYQKKGMVASKWSPIAWMAKLTPQGRVLSSNDRTSRAVMQELTDMHGKIEGDYTPTSVESLIRLKESKVSTLDAQYRNASDASKLSPDEFNDGVNASIRYGTVHENSEVNQMAKKVQGFWEDTWEEAFQARVPGTFTTRMENGKEVIEKVVNEDALQHLTRAYDQVKIRQDLPGFYTKVENGMRKRAIKDRAEIEFQRSVKRGELGATMATDEPLIHTLRADKKKNAYNVERLNRLIGAERLKKSQAVKRGEPVDAFDKRMAELNIQRDKYKVPLDELEAAIARVKKYKASEKKFEKLLAKHEIPDDLTLQMSAQNVVDKIVNMRPGDSGVVASSISVKKRSLKIDDIDIDEFLIKDIPELMQRYNRDVGNKAVMAKRAGEGDVMWDGPIGRVRDQYNAKAQSLDMEGKGKEAQQVRNEGRRQVEDLQVVRDRLLGLDSPPTYNAASARRALSALRTIRNWNTVTMLGGVTLSSVPEMFRALAQYGFKTTIKGQKRALKDLKLNLRKLPKDDLALLASATSRMQVNNPRMGALTDYMDEPALTSIERHSRNVTDRFMTLSGIKHFDTDMRMLSAYSMNHKMTQQIMSGKIDVAEFKRFGFQDTDLKNLTDMVKKHGRKEDDGMFNMRIDQWGDARLREKMEAGILREANKITTSAGVGDRPIFMSTELGKTMFQYRTFGLASINRILIPLAQGSTGEIIKGVTLPAVSATLMLMTRRALQGRDPIPEEVTDGNYSTPEARGFMTDVLNYAGLTGIGADAVMTIDKASDMGIFNSTKFRNRDKWGLVLGPTAGTVSAGFNAANVQTGVDSRLRSMRKLTPYQNMFYLRNLINQAEKATAQGLGGSGMYVD